MKRLSKCLAAFGVLAVLYVVMLASPLPAQADNDNRDKEEARRHARPVTVTGSVSITGTPAVTITGTPTVNLNPSQPVPVTGSVSITGTPTVNVNPATSMPVTGTVDIGNPPTNPVLVRNVDSATTQEPFTMYHGFFVEDGVAGKNESFGVVPAGKRFVIELISVEVHIQAGQAPFTSLIRHPDFLNVFVPLVQQPNAPDLFIGTLAAKFTVDGGQEITLNAGRRSSPAAGLGTANARLFGYLVDAP